MKNNQPPITSLSENPKGVFALLPRAGRWEHKRFLGAGHPRAREDRLLGVVGHLLLSTPGFAHREGRNACRMAWLG